VKFLGSTLPGSIIAVDITDVGPATTTAPCHQFGLWNEWQEYLSRLGAPQVTLDEVASAVKQTGHAVLEF
jgi:hypothetical protein